MMPAEVTPRTMLLSELLQGIATLSDDEDCEVAGLALSDTQVQPGFVFFALAGTKQHGFDYAADAVKRGASAVVWESDNDNGALPALLHSNQQQSTRRKVPVIAVAGLQQKLGFICARYFKEPAKQIPVIGITGTNGKTSCSHFLAQALNLDAPTAVIGTLGNGLVEQLSQATHTTPDVVTLHGLLRNYVDSGANSVVMEVSSHGLEQGRVAGVTFEAAIFTNLSRDHLDYHGDMQSYANAKKSLFLMPGLKTAIINYDDANGREIVAMLDQHREQTLAPKIISYGIRHDANHDSVQALDVRLSVSGIEFTIDSPWGRGVVHSSLLGRFNVSNLLAVFCALLVMGVPFDAALARLNGFTTIAGRMQRIVVDENETLFVVDYAHTPDALQNTLKSLREHMGATRGKLWCVFGCGGDRDRGKRREMGAIATAFADQVVITDDNPRTEASEQIIADIVSGLPASHTAKLIPDRSAAIQFAVDAAAPADIVLVAGKGHEQYQIIGTEKRAYDGDDSTIRAFLQRKRTNGVKV